MKKRIKFFKEYIKENLSESDLLNQFRNEPHYDVIIELLKKVDESVNDENEEERINLIKEFVDNKEANIKGLINDSDIYDFYIEYTSEIDDILSEGDFFKKPPLDYDVIGLYDYIIYATKHAVSILFSKILEKYEKENT